ncbi:HD-GYP domain-containing protein [Marispirochaeta aestuarii]|uniref:HD-GYP domain-containing protein n=1 Tax=Marispirochaeta aestuarii TaxID=1963862 RepID=UPI001301A722|nr:HD domain-containing phosphohydrolase [Marispirochaeta aestuarii]
MHRFLFTITSAAVILFLAFGLFLFYDRSTRINSDTLRDELGFINVLIRSVHDHARLGNRESLEAMNKAAEEARRALPPRFFDSGTETFLHQLADSPSEEELRAAVTELGGIARRISASYYENREQSRLVFIGFGLSMMVLVGILLALALRFHLEHTRYVGRGAKLLESLERILNFESENIDFSPRWLEEEELLRQVEGIAAAHRSNRELAEHRVYGTLEAFIPRMREILSHSVPCDRLAVAFVDTAGHVIAESASSVLPVTHLEPGFIEELKDTSLGSILTSRKTRIINDLPRHYEEIHQSESTKLILEEGIRASITVPIEIQEIMAETTRAFVSLMERKDNETSLHIIRMSRYSYILARELAKSDSSITPMMLREILWFAPLHDIGKIGIPDRVLQKNGPLDGRERSLIEDHVNIGLSVIHSMNSGVNRIIDLELLNTAENIIASHHERFDGTGYPRGLAGKDIPVSGRIVALADVFDALTSKRPYKEAFSIDKSMGIIEAGLGSHFDPDVYAAFLKALPEIRLVYDRYKEI